VRLPAAQLALSDSKIRVRLSTVSIISRDVVVGCLVIYVYMSWITTYESRYHFELPYILSVLVYGVV
jgi:hypothetical protein